MTKTSMNNAVMEYRAFAGLFDGALTRWSATGEQVDLVVMGRWG
ncbi:MAG: hypothetical protein M0003_13155 [Acidithiobacillus sp.]|nr:hypothetical protein [Acidithiobacillus sp.]